MKNRIRLDKSWVKVVGAVIGVTIALGIVRVHGWLQPLEWATYDYFFQIRPLEPIDERIVIVGITESDIDKYNYPISDRDLARLLLKIKAGKPRLIGLDLIRNLPVREGEKELERVFQTTPNLLGVKTVVGNKQRRIAPPPILEDLQQVTAADVVVDSDGTLRRGLFYVADNDKTLFSLGAALALLYLQDEGIYPKAIEERGTQIRDVRFYPFKKSDGGYQNADDGGTQFLVNFRNPLKSFKRVSMAEVLEDKIEPDFWKGKIVLIGMTATSIKDDFYTPYSYSLNEPPKLIHGIEVQANFASHILSAVLDGRPIIKTIPDEAEVAFILFWGLGTAIAIRLVHSLKNYVILFGVIFGIVTGLIVFLLVGSWTAFLQGWWLPFVPSVFLISGTSILSYCLILQEKNQGKRSGGNKKEEKQPPKSRNKIRQRSTSQNHQNK